MLNKKKTAVIVSGYFNPLHKGHLEYFINSRSHGDELFVIVNSDFQRKLKNSKKFQDEKERKFIVSNIKQVDKAFLSVDEDRTVCKTIEKIHKLHNDKYNFIFANGGDQNNNTIPEKKICDQLNIKLVDGMGNKIQSSSWLLKNH